MSPSTISRAAAAVTLLASTTNAAFNAGSTANVAMYWGQGPNQAPLTTACADESIDVVNVAFVNGFPAKIGDWPATNFGNACYDYYKHPTDSTQDNKLLRTCPSIENGIKLCQKNGKKVLLSLGGGAPTSYYFPSEAVAKYTAEFLMGAFGPVTPAWTANNGPRPFGDSFVDGFDLDLEAEVNNVPRPEDIKAHYAYFVNQLKVIQPSLLISAAPQCEVPDVRLADAIKGAPFDMIFTQFYNTPKCSARAGISEPNNVEGFSFKKWADWLQANSFKQDVKLYIGLPASPAAAPSYPDHHLSPNEAYTLANQWKQAYPGKFGGIMLWEDKRSRDNEINCGNYGSWMKAILN
ncbi:glycoside hydrolase superfamily, partial [Ampelomyces quisqualis]